MIAESVLIASLFASPGVHEPVWVDPGHSFAETGQTSARRFTVTLPEGVSLFTSDVLWVCERDGFRMEFTLSSVTLDSRRVVMEDPACEALS